uniref:Glycosyltransferase n=1 Tax=Panagrolaimus sp. JU765 TaxID=591449 RepID=A0AC34RN59_9BILA
MSFNFMRNEYYDSLCPKITSEDLMGSKNITNNRIAIVLPVLRPTDYASYKPALDTLECYANHFGYQYVLLNMTNNGTNGNCPHSDVFFKRHCFVVEYMKENIGKIDYILFLDADIGVINPCHTIQEYIDDDPNVEIAFYDRYYDHEIAAGSYFARNSEFSRKFLTYWANYNLPKSFHGTDNGAIHQVFMEHHFKNQKLQKQCYHYWETSVNYDTLFAFQACTRHALGNGTYFVDGKAKIVRKGTWGWVRDGWLTKTKFAPNDFMFHGWKKEKLGGEWVWPFNSTVFNMKECRYRSSFSSWIPKKEFLISNTEIRRLLDTYTANVYANYVKILENLGLIGKSTTKSQFSTLKH